MFYHRQLHDWWLNLVVTRTATLINDVCVTIRSTSGSWICVMMHHIWALLFVSLVQRILRIRVTSLTRICMCMTSTCKGTIVIMWWHFGNCYCVRFLAVLLADSRKFSIAWTLVYNCPTPRIWQIKRRRAITSTISCTNCSEQIRICCARYSRTILD